MAATKKSFEDTSDECVICLSPFDCVEKEITLGCGHRYHLDCVKEQLKHAQPNPARRLLFGGCRCAKCDVFCDHESLRDLTRQTDKLRGKVDSLILEQVGHQDLLELGRRTFAYYLCGFCQKPYFGGTIQCADTSEGELPPEDRLCPTCSPKTQTICQNPAEHKAYHVWKCRYCCQVASHVCYGSVHFCNDCHDRNTQRVARKTRKLDAIVCRGKGTCQYPIREGKELHQNGSKPDCEQVYYCAWCESSNRATLSAEPHGSHNLIKNSSGAQGLRYWISDSRHGRFTVERSEIPVDTDTTTNFVSNFHWCVLAQVVDLSSVVRDPSQVTVEVSARFMARTDCPSTFRMEAHVQNHQRRVIHRMSTPQLQAPADGWDVARIQIPPTQGAVSVVMIIFGKDSRFWQGLYGSKVAACRMRIMASQDELDQIMRTQRNEGEAAFRNHTGRLSLNCRQIIIAVCLVPALSMVFWGMVSR